jgi:hypothetical protein
MSEGLDSGRDHELVEVSLRRETVRATAGDRQTSQMMSEEEDVPEVEAGASWRISSGKERDPALWGCDAGRGESSAHYRG